MCVVYAPQGSQNQNLKNAPELNFVEEDNEKKVYSYICTYMPYSYVKPFVLKCQK